MDPNGASLVRSIACILIALGGVLAMALLAGCAAAPAPAESLIVTTDSFDAAFGVSRDVLRGRYFEADRVDRRAGVITTLPSTAGASWELWRRDSADAGGRALAALHTIRKTVLVKIAEPESGGCRIAVTVTMERQQAPNLEPTATSDLYSLYSRHGFLGQQYGTGGRAETRWERKAGAWWTDIGRDLALEHDLLKEIAARLENATVQPADQPATRSAAPPS